jgi:hypothetical protein
VRAKAMSCGNGCLLASEYPPLVYPAYDIRSRPATDVTGITIDGRGMRRGHDDSVLIFVR